MSRLRRPILIRCMRCNLFMPTMAEDQVDPAYPSSSPIPWPIPHTCRHGNPCHGPTLSTMTYQEKGGPCAICLSDFKEKKEGR